MCKKQKTSWCCKSYVTVHYWNELEKWCKRGSIDTLLITPLKSEHTFVSVGRWYSDLYLPSPPIQFGKCLESRSVPLEMPWLCGRDEAAVQRMLGSVLASAELGIVSGSCPTGQLSQEVGNLPSVFRAWSVKPQHRASAEIWTEG